MTVIVLHSLLHSEEPDASTCAFRRWLSSTNGAQSQCLQNI